MLPMPTSGPARAPGTPTKPRLDARAKRVAQRLLPSGVRRSRLLLPLLALLASVTSGHVVELVRMLEAADVPVWLVGGWGVDALVGRRTRRHSDLDLLIDDRHTSRALEALASAGYRVSWSSVVEDALFPERMWLADARGRQVDLHPVALEQWLATTVASALPGAPDPAGAAFTAGVVRGESLPCLSRELQLAAHEGYAARRVDDRDVALLRGIAQR
jgi:lincosamide nucleotidyltransferase A/C/D/E